MMKWIERIKAWFKKEPIQGPTAGPIFRPIFRKVNYGTETSDQINHR